MLSHLSSQKNQRLNPPYHHFILCKRIWESLNSDSEDQVQDRADQGSGDRFFKELNNR